MFILLFALLLLSELPAVFFLIQYFYYLWMSARE